ncbi:hypothetical protein FXO38_01750, partial [Capsicum annuum]
CPSEPRRAISMSINPERNSAKDMQEYARKSKNLLTAFLGRHGHGQGSRKAGTETLGLSARIEANDSKCS